MGAPNANPSNCGGVSVACCSNRLPQVLQANFSGANTCEFTGPVYLTWDPNASQWSSPAAICCGFQLNLACVAGAWSLTLQGFNAMCGFSIAFDSSACDGPSGFSVSFDLTQHLGGCFCCPANSVFTVTITNGMAP